MAQTSLLDSFDPFATHPFTNNCGLVPQPPQSAPYPTSLFSLPRRSHMPSKPQASSPSSTQAPSKGMSSPKAPQPRYASSAPQPIFEPYRRETSTPDLVLKKKFSSAKR
ncbi:hypothetical protein HGRIS_013207 [Hohenbuehelia grisea]|uniref:Uncharacterized protein n=1 Tax=Hohenbuehelia grisea TaxID=104357 RepID=A0ABR3IV07_9AGAR